MTSEIVARRRESGALWERNFCVLAAMHNKEFTPHQLVRKEGAAVSWRQEGNGWRKQLLPDVVVWSAPGEHHEIKHKNKMNNGCYGYEAYRLHELVRFANTTGQRIYYTIHDWELAGASSSIDPMANRIEDWLCADVADLSRSRTGEFTGRSIIGGVMKSDVRQFMWDASRYFRPLADVWRG